ncbi:MAG: pyridoxal phosphate-dependent aminotransferase [Anaerolineae bacterium]|nr:pyridoxal phosphate-dependent aminotransferase [Anaerolineae bacterium]
MTKSQTKELVIQRHIANDLLQAPALSPMPRSERDLGVEHPTRPLETSVAEAVAAALHAGQTHYVDVPGMPRLRELLAEWLQSMGLHAYTADRVLVTAGVQEARFLSIQVVGDLLGGVALPDVVHPGALKAAGVRRLQVHRLPTEEDQGFLPTLSGIREALEKGCRLLYLESPVRLTGAAFDAASVREIARLLEEHDAAAIWDQGLAPWAEGCPSLAAEPGMGERTIVLGEAWPGAGLESMLLGYVAAKLEWWEKMRSQKQVISICTSTPSQLAGVELAGRYPEIHAEQSGNMARLHRWAVEEAKGLSLQPVAEGSVNLLALCLKDSGRAKAHLREKGLEVAWGEDFGAPGIVRLAMTSESTLAEAFAALREAISV